MAQIVAVLFLGFGIILTAYGIISPYFRSEVFSGAIILLLMGNLVAIIRVGDLLEERFKRR